MKLCCATICWPHSREFLCFRSMVSRTMVESPARYHLDQASSLSPGWSQVQALQPAFTFSHFVADGLFQLMTLGSSTLRQVITAQLLAVGTRYKICDQLLLITWPTWVATWVATWVEPGLPPGWNLASRYMFCLYGYWPLELLHYGMVCFGLNETKLTWNI